MVGTIMATGVVVTCLVFLGGYAGAGTKIGDLGNDATSWLLGSVVPVVVGCIVLEVGLLQQCCANFDATSTLLSGLAQ